MNNMFLEYLLGKNYLSINEFVSCNFRTKEYGDGFYINSEFLDEIYYTMPYNFITILTDEKKNIESVTVHFKGIINREFYDVFNSVYGEPNSMLVIEKRNVISEGIYGDDNFKYSARKSDLELREGTFEENPLFIIWEKDGFEIKAFLRQKNSFNKSEITFKKLD